MNYFNITKQIKITNNNKIAKKLRLIKAFGVNKTFSQRKTPGLYNSNHLGTNYRMSEINAAIGIE